MKTIITIIFGLFASFMLGQIQNAKTVEVAINGNCGMCKSTIEKAANIDDEARLVWNKETKKAQLTYDSKKTTPKAVLKRVAQAGYDNQYYKAADATYSNLPGCCQYDRNTHSVSAKSCSGKKSCNAAQKSCCSGNEKSCSGKCKHKQ